MSENIDTTAGQEDQHSQQPEATSVTVTPMENEARSQGWVPKEEWEGDPEKWRPAKEYVDRGELLKRIEQQGRSLKETNKALHTLAEHHRKVREVEYQRAIQDLKTQRKAALIEQDMERVAELDENIDYVKEQKVQLSAEPIIPEVQMSPQALVAWESNNSWYKSDRAMTSFANDLAVELRGKGYQLEDALKEIDKEIRKEFPHKFRNVSKPSASAVEGNSRGRSTGSSKSDFQLSEDERRVMHKFIKLGAVKDEQDYIDQLKAVK